MKLGIDIDGTIKHTQRAAIELYNKEFNMNVKEEDVETYYLDEPYGLTGKEGQKVWRSLESKIYEIGVPLDHAPEVLDELVKEGHEVYFITARPNINNIEEITKEWLKKHGFPYNGENLYMDAQNKGRVATEIGIDLFFEDDPEHINSLLAAGISTVIVDMKYNQGYEGIQRMTDWIQGKKMIKQLEEEKNLRHVNK